MEAAAAVLTVSSTSTTTSTDEAAGVMTPEATVLSVMLAIVVLYVTVATWIVSSLLLAPPHYAHRTPKEGLAKQGNPIDPVWQPYINNPLVDFGLAFSEVEFHPLAPSKGNAKVPVLTLRGWHVPSDLPGASSKGVIGVHGGGRDRREWHRILPWLHAAGYNVLLFDYREHGISDGTSKGLDWGMDAFRDVLGAAEFARHMLRWERVCLMGTSNGAVLSLLAAAADNETTDQATRLIDAVIADSAYCTPDNGMTDILMSYVQAMPPLVRYTSAFEYIIPLIVRVTLLRVRRIYDFLPSHYKHKSALEAAAMIEGRSVFMIHGTKDRRFPISHSKRLHERVPESSHKQLWLVPDGRHTECYDAAPTEYRERVLAFLERALTL